MEPEFLRRYGGIAIGLALAFVLFSWIGRTRAGAALGLQRRSGRQLLWMGAAMLAGLVISIVLLEVTRPLGWVVPAFAILGMAAMIVLAGVQARRHPDRRLPRTDFLLRWVIPITLALLGVGFAIRELVGPGAAFGIVAGLGLGLLPGVVMLAVFSLVVWVARAGRT